MNGKEPQVWEGELVEWIQKGKYGFIKPKHRVLPVGKEVTLEPNDDYELFVHSSEIRGIPRVGMRVRYSKAKGGGM